VWGVGDGEKKRKRGREWVRGRQRKERYGQRAGPGNSRSVKDCAANAHKQHAQRRDHQVPGIASGGTIVQGYKRGKDDGQVGDGVPELCNVGGHHVVLLAPIFTGRDGPPVPVAAVSANKTTTSEGKGKEEEEDQEHTREGGCHGNEQRGGIDSDLEERIDGLYSPKESR
jgi:hypothetical protein